MEKIQSTCNYCALDCNLDFYVDHEQIIKVVPTKGYPVNNGFACIKGLSLDKQQTVVKGSPLPRVKQSDGSFKQISWSKAYKLVADKLLSLQAKYGRESIAGLSTGQLTMEEFALFGHLMRNLLKTNVDGNTRLCMASAVMAYKQSYGFDAPGYTIKDIELSDTIIFIGANPVVAHPVLWGRVKQNPAKKIIVIDPRRSETAKNADYWYPLKWRSDLWLFYTVAQLLIEQDHLDYDFIQRHTEHFHAFKTFLQDYPLEKGVAATGLSKRQILELTEWIRTGKRVSFWWTMGVNQGYEAVRTAQSIINVALMTGNIGKPGTGANSLTGQCNAMGSRLYSNTAALFGGGDFDNPVRRKAVAKALDLPEEMLAQKPTITYNQIVEGINEGKIKGLWILCTNPRHSWTNNETFRTAMEKLEFLVVQDVYGDTESSENCDVMLPVVPGIKKEGTYINLERRLSAMRPCLKKAPDERTDYEVILGIGKAMGMGKYLDSWATPQDAFRLMQQCAKDMPCDFSGISWNNLENSHGIQWPFCEGETLESDERRLYADGNFFTPTKKARFVFEAVRENPLPTNSKYSYVLNTGRASVGQWHTQTRTREVAFVEDAISKRAYIYMNTETAREHGIQWGETIRVYSINGQDAPFIVLVTDDVQKRELYAPIHYLACNKLTPSVYDTYSKEPSYKATPVYFEKAESTSC